MQTDNCAVVIDVSENQNALIVTRKDSAVDVAIVSDSSDFLKDIIIEILKTSGGLPY